MKSIPLAIGFLLSIGAAAAQPYLISTVAGGGPPLTPKKGVEFSIKFSSKVALDATGNVYFVHANCVFMLDRIGVVTRVAGNTRFGYSGDGGPATSARLSGPGGLAIDRAGNLFLADSGNLRIRRVSPGGIISTVAGNGERGLSGDGGPAVNASMNQPVDLALDGAGNLFIADSANRRIRKVAPSGIITTYAHTNVGFDAGAVAADEAGKLFIANPSENRVYQVNPDGTLTVVAGNGGYGFSGDDGPATAARLAGPRGLAVDTEGNLFIADTYSSRIRKVSPGGIITSVAGTPGPTSPTYAGFSGDGGPATAALLARPSGVAVDISGALLIADLENSRIRKVSPNGIITTVVGGVTDLGDGGPATGASLDATGVTLDGAGNLFIADSRNNRVRKIAADGIITTVAGTGEAGFSGDGGPATSAAVFSPDGVAVDSAGNLFFAGFDENDVIGCFPSDDRVRKVTPDGLISTVAGNGRYSSSNGDGGPATDAGVYQPSAVAIDGAGNLLIAEFYGSRIRKVSPAGIITTVAGSQVYGKYFGDGGPATSAGLTLPTGLAVDGRGGLFIGDTYSHRIRKVSPDGIITTVAGTGSQGFSGDGGPATAASLNTPGGVAVDRRGNLFIADSYNYRVRRVSPDGIITTIAGSFCCRPENDGPASREYVNPRDVATDAAGNVYVASHDRVYVLRPSNHSVLIGAVLDAASQSAIPVSPGKMVVIYGAGLGPAKLIQNQPDGGRFGTSFAGTTVSFNGVAAPILYTSETQVGAIVPYALTGAVAQVTITYQEESSDPLSLPLASSSPGIFTLNQSGGGQAAAINAVDGTVNTAANPVQVGGYVSLYATGEGQTVAAGVDGSIGGTLLTRPVLPVSVTVGGIPAAVQYAGGAPGQVSGLMQLNVQIPPGVKPGGYVPVVLQVGERITTRDAVWIAVGNGL